MRRLLVDALRAGGYDVAEVPDGGRLLVRLVHDAGADCDEIDLIISDIRMPGCSGLEVVTALRGAGCGVPIILMTAFGDEETRQRAEALGAVLFDKPFEVDDLRTAVINLLERSRSA